MRTCRPHQRAWRKHVHGRGRKNRANIIPKAPDWGLLGPIFQNEEVGETHEAGRSGEKDGN